MVIGIFKAESSYKVKNNPYYGSYESNTVHSRTIVNEKYVGLVPPKNGIRLIVNNIDGEQVTFTIGKYYFTGEPEKTHTEETYYEAAFEWGKHILEVTVDYLGQLICLDVWCSSGDYDDGNDPDYHYSKRAKGIKWELVDM